MTFDEFMQSSWRNQYVEEPGFWSLYVRKSTRYIESHWINRVIDLSSFEVERKGQGVFTRFVERLKSEYPEHTIYVECVVNPRLGPHLEKIGFARVDKETGEHYALYSRKEK
jgi:hypothetical protein